MKSEFKQQIVELLDRHRIMTIATNRPDGWPQATVVGYANVGLLIYCLIGRQGQKFSNIARDPRVSIAISNDYPDPMQIRGLSMAARAAETRDPDEIKRATEALFGRYPEYRAMPTPDPGLIAFLRIIPEVVSILDYTRGFAHTDLVRVTEADLVEHLETRRHNWLVASTS